MRFRRVTSFDHNSSWSSSIIVDHELYGTDARALPHVEDDPLLFRGARSTAPEGVPAAIQSFICREGRRMFRGHHDRVRDDASSLVEYSVGFHAPIRTLDLQDGCDFQFLEGQFAFC